MQKQMKCMVGKEIEKRLKLNKFGKNWWIFIDKKYSLIDDIYIMI